MSSWPYQAAHLHVGPNGELGDESFYTNLRDELLHSTEALVTVAGRDQTITVYQAGQAVLQTRYRARASADSWRHIPAGYYEVTRVRNERYSSLEQAYYQHVSQLKQRMAIHAPAINNDGSA